MNDDTYGGKTFDTLLGDIYNNSESKRKAVNELINKYSLLVNNVNDLLIIGPMLKDLLEVGVKNDDLLVKTAAIVQRVMAKHDSGEDGNILLTEDEKEKLLQIKKDFTLPAQIQDSTEVK